MFNFSKEGKSLAVVKGDGKMKNKLLCLSDAEDDSVKTFKDVQLTGNDKFQIIPDKDADRIAVYACGANGSGKSYFLSGVAKEYRKMYKDDPIIMFSEKDYDKVFDDDIKNLKRIKVNEDLLKNPITWEEITEVGRCCLIFDDIDSITPNKLKREVYSMMDKALKLGRSFKISVLCSAHDCCSGKETKAMLNECGYIVFYPMSYNRNIKYLCENYVGMNKEQIDRMRSNKSRWACYIKSYPAVLIQEQNAMFI